MTRALFLCSLCKRSVAPCFAAACSPKGGRGEAALTTADILDNSEAFRQPMDYFSHTTNTATLACMHGSAWSGAEDAAARPRQKARQQLIAIAGPTAVPPPVSPAAQRAAARARHRA